MSNRFQRRTGRFWAGFGFALLLTVLILLALLCDPDVQSRLPWNRSPAPGPQTEGALTVYFLDVGQGDAALLRSGAETMLIDGGPRENEDRLLADLEELGVDHLDYMVATHPHEDHIGGLSGVMEQITVEECWMPEDAADTWTYTHFLETLDTHDVAVTVPQPGDTLSFGSCTVTVLAPLSTAEEHNNNSLVLRVVCGGTAFLFTGDMEDAEEGELLRSGADLSADVLKVAHHGSRYTSSMEFLRAVSPEMAVISCGADNDYGHPHGALLQRLGYLEIETYRTDQMGTITVTSDGQTLSVATEQEVTP
ncbi:MAG: MBL fold metallo-hydrolase [Oscillospiraceae bacterium]|nr:MBL fold metallo-hydrolase [Oscillospiraceae bacterium]